MTRNYIPFSRLFPPLLLSETNEPKHNKNSLISPPATFLPRPETLHQSHVPPAARPRPFRTPAHCSWPAPRWDNRRYLIAELSSRVIEHSLRLLSLLFCWGWLSPFSTRVARGELYLLPPKREGKKVDSSVASFLPRSENLPANLMDSSGGWDYAIRESNKTDTLWFILFYGY